jgi:DNA-binding XRE family transcriptional regulator
MTKNDYDNSKLIKLRESKKMTQEDVAETIGVSRFTIIRAEQGQSASWKLLQTLSAFYGISISELIHPAQIAA